MTFGRKNGLFPGGAHGLVWGLQKPLLDMGLCELLLSEASSPDRIPCRARAFIDGTYDGWIDVYDFPSPDGSPVVAFHPDLEKDACAEVEIVGKRDGFCQVNVSFMEPGISIAGGYIPKRLVMVLAQQVPGVESMPLYASPSAGSTVVHEIPDYAAREDEGGAGPSK